MERMVVTSYSPLVGKTMATSGFRDQYHVNIASIERAGKIYDLPSKDMLIMPGDRLTVLGDEDQLTRVRADIEVEPDMLIHDHSDNEMNIYRLEIKEHGPLAGNTIRNVGMKSTYHSMVIAIERGEEYMLNPKADTSFEPGDVVWMVSPDDLNVKDFNLKDKV